MTLSDRIHVPGPAGILEILLLAAAFYYIILFFRGTRGVQVLVGFVLVLVSLLLLTQLLHLDTLNWILRRSSVYLAVAFVIALAAFVARQFDLIAIRWIADSLKTVWLIAFVIIFQPEIRRVLAELGKQHMFTSTAGERTLVDNIVQAVVLLAERKIGALIAVEREIGTRVTQDTGTRLDGLVTPELLASIFYPHTPLHDGGVIIRENRIVAAGCLFPLSPREELSKTLGTRHRAAIGLTEETDAIVVVVSEETGTISVAYKGRLTRGLDEDRLRRLLSAVLLKAPQAKSRWRRARAQLDLTPEGMAKTDAVMKEEFDHGS
jgi:diadenylate cyclase